MDIALCRTFIFINHPFQDAEISGQVAFAESRALELDAELKRQRLAQATPTTWLKRWWMNPWLFPVNVPTYSNVHCRVSHKKWWWLIGFRSIYHQQLLSVDMPMNLREINDMKESWLSESMNEWMNEWINQSMNEMKWDEMKTSEMEMNMDALKWHEHDMDMTMT